MITITLAIENQDESSKVKLTRKDAFSGWEIEGRHPKNHQPYFPLETLPVEDDDLPEIFIQTLNHMLRREKNLVVGFANRGK